MKKKSKVIEVEVVGKEKPGALVVAAPAKLKEFDVARTLIADIRDLGQRAQHKSLLLGFELNKLKLKLGVKRGGDHCSKKAKPHGAALLPWHDLVEQQTGLSNDTCDRWMKIAHGAAKSLPILMAPDVLKQPFSELPAARQAEVAKILHKAVDGQTMHQMMLSFGAWKDKGLNHPPKATKASAAKRKANADDETLSAAKLIEAAMEDINALHDMHIGEAWKSLDTADLADLDNKLAAYGAAVAAELKSRRKAKN